MEDPKTVGKNKNSETESDYYREITGNTLQSYQYFTKVLKRRFGEEDGSRSGPIPGKKRKDNVLKANFLGVATSSHF